jgi:hypothetical protein
MADLYEEQFEEDLVEDPDFQDDGESVRTDVEPGVDMETLQNILKNSIDLAVNYAEEDLAEERQTEHDYYEGLPLENDENLDATRSKVISKDVHDTVHAILPSLLRIFFSGNNLVEYDPNGPEDEAFAKQATEYVNKIVLQKDNKCFIIFYDMLKDCLIKGLGVVKYYWDESYRVEGTEYSGLTQQEFQMIAGDPQVSEIFSYEEVMSEIGPLISCEVVRKISNGGMIKVEAVPPEERLISKEARTVDDAHFYGHRRLMTVGEVVAMGFDYDQVVLLGGSENMETNEEAIQRFDNQTFEGSSEPSDPSMRQLEFVEAYLKVDLDGDGIAERHKICCGGTSYEILNRDDGTPSIELVDAINFAEFCPDPEPHIATGNSVSKQVLDIQRIKSNVMRGVLDSLSRCIFPREEVVETAVNIADVLNPEIGAIIRTQDPIALV